MKRRSLIVRTMRTTIITCIVLAATSMFIGLSIYGSGIINKYVQRSFEIARHAHGTVEKGTNAVSLSRQVMDIYHSLSQEERESKDYLNHYSDIDTRLDDGGTYDELFHVLQSYCIQVNDVYLGMYDRESNALVYIVDADEREDRRLKTGEWDSVSEEECQKFLDWDGEGILYDISDTDKYGWMCTAGYPLRDESGEIYAFILADVMLDKVVTDLRVFALKIVLAMLVSTFLLTWFVKERIKKTVAEPINEIARAAEDYVEDKKRGVEKDHFTGLGTKSGYEIENLAEIMAGMELELLQHEERLTSITAEKERINTELRMASQIQKSMLPHTFPPFPDRTEFELYASMDPAREVGGDFYDFFLIDEDHLCLVIADVSGKGIPASLFMMVSKAVLQSCAMLGRSPGEILTKTNSGICSNNQVNMFVTVWIGILEISTGKFTAANAGHEYPIIKGEEGRFELFKDKHGFVIGGMDGVTYREYEIQMNPGDQIFLYTDGLTEAMDATGNMFGTDRILEALNEVTGAFVQTQIEHVRKAVDDFVKEEEQFDDLTMLCFKYKGV